MIGRLREGFSDLITTLSARARLRRPEQRSSVKGCMRNIIVIKPPNPMFLEAVFILKDDYFNSPSVSRQELLLQAKMAAQEYVDSVVPPARRVFPLSFLLPCLFLAAALGILRLTGLI